jgi:hypothetical protein
MMFIIYSNYKKFVITVILFTQEKGEEQYQTDIVRLKYE